MENMTKPTTTEIETAWPIASRRGGYAPAKENIAIRWDSHPNFKLADGTQYPFVRLGAVPERFHAAIRDLATGSMCPESDNKRDSFYTHNVYRLLRALGVPAEFVNPVEDNKQNN
jgi:hypothetical protein